MVNDNESEQITEMMIRKQSEQERVAFLLSQVGGRAAQEFARLLEPLCLTPADAGILRFVARSEGISQQALAAALKMHASRLVALIDDLESRGLLVREVHPTDRRLYSLALTTKGNETLLGIRDVAEEHNRLMCAGLTSSETAELQSLLSRIATQQGLSAGVHPGYRSISKKSSSTKRRSLQKTRSR